MSVNTKGMGLILLGVMLVLAGISLGAYNLWDGNRAGESAQAALEHLDHEIPVHQQLPDKQEIPEDAGEVEIPDYLLNPEMEMPVQQMNGVSYIGVLKIPALSIELPIVSQWSDELLRLAPCRYYGSAYKNDMVIAGHNYRKHLGSLSRISVGDLLTFTDVDGNLFSYQAVEVEVLKPHQIEEMCAGEWDLTLFTCTVGGRTRFTVRCESI